MEQPSRLSKILKVALVVNLVVLDVLVGFLIFKLVNTAPELRSSPPESGGDTGVVQVDICGPDCQKYIDAKMVFPSPAPTTITKTVYQTTPKSKTRSVTYVPIPGTGSTINNIWTDLSGTDFYFSPADYPGLVEVYLEANVRLLNGNGMAYFQLADITHGTGVQGSDLQTSTQTSTSASSGMISFWAGKNLIRVQAKSLTADTAVFDGGRLKVVVEN